MFLTPSSAVESDMNGLTAVTSRSFSSVVLGVAMSAPNEEQKRKMSSKGRSSGKTTKLSWRS